jgi:predicted enzyme related to lactoylglutathione lyase
MNPVIHFGMPAGDRKRVADFYAAAFGWQMKQFGPEMGNYILATTTESDEKSMPIKPGAINGGFFTRSEQDPSPKITIQVDDIQDAMKKVVAAGGTVIGGRMPGSPPEDMPGLGIFVNIRDTEGNAVSLMQPARQ